MLANRTDPDQTQQNAGISEKESKQIKLTSLKFTDGHNQYIIIKDSISHKLVNQLPV